MNSFDSLITKVEKMSVINVIPNIPNISANGTLELSSLFNVYYFSPISNGITYTYILPPITSDGMNFKIVRNDTTTSILNVNASNNIIYGSSISTSIRIDIKRSSTFISYNSTWYVIEYQGIDNTYTTSIFSGNFLSNSTNPYQLFSGSAAEQLFCSFSYLGRSKGQVINNGAFVLIPIGGNPSITIILRDKNGNQIAISAVTPITIDVVVFFSNINQMLLPINPESLQLFILISGGGGNKVGVSSFIIY